MKAVYSPAHRMHSPAQFLVAGTPRPSPETPARAEMLLTAVRDAGYSLIEPPDYGPGPRAAVHSPDYLRFLETIHAQWRLIDGASADVIPNVHPQRGETGYPASPVGQAGYHMADTACPISEGTWSAICATANAAAHAAVLVSQGDREVYALCRPPGHHAFADMAGGFCYLNNTAIAAQVLRETVPRVAILDVDVHHGNGTQSIFYDRPDILTVSLHTDPATYYPFFWGYAHERGVGSGQGANLNIPLQRGMGDDPYMTQLDRTLEKVTAFTPGALVVALGLDAHEDDPLAGLSITTEGFGRMGAAIGSLGLPTALVQEGGYPSEALGRNLGAFLQGFLDARP